MIKKPSIGWALGGGGVRGIAILGFFRAMHEARLFPDFVAGTSSGAFMGALYCFGVQLEDMDNFLFDLSWKSVTEFKPSKLGLASNIKIVRHLKKNIGDKKFKDSPIPLKIVATNIETGESVAFDKGSVATAVQASTCIPAYFIPVKINGKNFVDGGISNTLPINIVRDMGADIVIGIDLINNLTPVKSALDVMNNSIIIMLHRNVDRSLHKNGKDILIIRPKFKKIFSDNKESLMHYYEEGYKATKRAIPKIKNMIKELEKS